MSMRMSCGCISYPCMHTQGVGLGQAQQSLYNEMIRQSVGLQNMHSIPVTSNPNENKINKKLLLLRK